ncbi:MAG: DUF1631 domain-containing protein [Alteromonadaceae bacterium]|nr:DUF1631 domain-containing protein [Alteromonadaceae bacterium]
MVKSNNVVCFSGKTQGERSAMPAELVRLRDRSGQTFRQVLARFFEQADDTLFALADKAGSNQDQTAYFDAMRELRLRRKSMTVSVLQHVSEAFNEMSRVRPGTSSSSLEEIEEDGLSLIDHEQLEQQVAINNLTTRLRNRYQESVHLLSARIRHLLPELDLSDAQMPLGPEVICSAIGEACADLDIDIRAKLVVLKLFERLMVGQLDAFYRDCNQMLIDSGVLPEMKRPPVGRPSLAAAPSKSNPSPSAAGHSMVEAPAASPGASSTENSPVTFQELASLLRQDQGEEVLGHARASAARVMDTGQLVSELDQLQVAARDSVNDFSMPLREQLQPLLQDSPSQVAQADGDVINLVAMLFDFIVEDRQLHPVMKVLIGRLQIPVLKVALSDRNFFNRGGHPVRKLLNELALAAIGWSEKREGARDPLRDKITEIVNRVLEEFTTDTALFEELLEDFGHFMDLDRRRRELVEQRLRDAEEGRAKQERASQLATEVIHAQTDGRDIPAPISHLLNEAWTRYLQWLVLRNGEDGEPWKRACEITARLVWSVDPSPVTEQTRAELLRVIPGIVDDVRKALQEISWDPFATDTVVRDLELAHVDVLQRLVTAPVEDQESEPEINAPGESVVEPDVPEQEVGEALESETPAEIESPVLETVEQPDETVPSIPEEWLAQADRLTVGSWVEIVDESIRGRCKLAAFIRATGKYIFVNRSGAKVAEYHREDLAEALRDGLITMLDDGLIFDRALESIIDNLRHNRKD